MLARSWEAAAFRVAVELVPQLRTEQSAQLWTRLAASACARTASPLTQRWLALYAAVGQRHGAAMLRDARALLAEGKGSADQERFAYLVASAMLGALAAGEPQAALEVWSAYGAKRWRADTVNLHLRFLLATAVFRAKPASELAQ